jgi:non-heme chloroperoxidase
MAGRRHRITTADGVVLEVREWGDPDGPELLLVTGVAQSYLSFVKQYAAPGLQRFRIVSYDPRGHGLSEKPSGEHWYREGRRWSGEVRCIIETLRLKRPVLAGWSLGGRIVRQYLVDYGDDALAGIVFVSARPVEVPEVVGPGNTVMAGLTLDDGGSRIEAASAFLRHCFSRQPSPEEFAFALAFNMLCPFEIRLHIAKWWTEPRISEAALRRVTKPTMVMHGLDDALVLPAAGKMTSGLIPHACTSWYEGCGHSVFFEEPERFNSELAAFVEEA